MKKVLASFLVCAGMAAAQITIPNGTKLRIRLDQSISSASAEGASQLS